MAFQGLFYNFYDTINLLHTNYTNSFKLFYVPTSLRDTPCHDQGFVRTFTFWNESIHGRLTRCFDSAPEINQKLQNIIGLYNQEKEAPNNQNYMKTS